MVYRTARPNNFARVSFPLTEVYVQQQIEKVSSSNQDFIYSKHYPQQLSIDSVDPLTKSKSKFDVDLPTKSHSTRSPYGFHSHSSGSGSSDSSTKIDYNYTPDGPFSDILLKPLPPRPFSPSPTEIEEASRPFVPRDWYRRPGSWCESPPSSLSNLI